jgi:hypothetical protein
MWTNGRTDMGKLKVAFRNFTNAPKLDIKTLSEAKRVLFGVQCKKKKNPRKEDPSEKTTLFLAALCSKRHKINNKLQFSRAIGRLVYLSLKRQFFK